MAPLPPTVYPAAFDRYSMNTRPIDTKLGEGACHERTNDRVFYCSRSTYIIYVYFADRYEHRLRRMLPK